MTTGKMKTNKMNEGAFVEDEKKPAKLSVVVAKTEKSGVFLISIVHPNRRADLSREVLYKEEHKAKDMLEALDIGKRIKDTQFADVYTTYEDIKFIPNYKKGKMKLNTKEEAQEDMSEINKLILNQEEKKLKQSKKAKNKKTSGKKTKKLS